MESGTILVIVVTSLTMIILIVFVLSALFFSSAVIRPPKRSHGAALQYHVKKQGLPENYYKNLNRIPWQFISRRGYTLCGEWILPDKDNNIKDPKANLKLLITVHGHGHNRMGMLKYLPFFLDKGYTVLIYDQVSSGLNKGKYSTLGYFEAKDLKNIIDSIFENHKQPIELGLLGESMGAATVLIEACTDNRPSFVIADCPFADLQEQLIYKLSYAYRLPRFPLIQLGSIVAKVRAGFAWKDVSPLTSIQNASGLPNIPILFVHGSDDTYIPLLSSQKLFDAKKGYKEILIVSGAKHTESILTDRQSYEEAIARLLLHSQSN